MKTRGAARASYTRHANSERNKIDNDKLSVSVEASPPVVYLIRYPIEGAKSEICNSSLSDENLKICEQILDVHGIHNIKYQCTECAKEFDTINSIKLHYPACNKKQNKENNLAVNDRILPPNNIQSNNSVVNIPPLQCVEYYEKSIEFIVKDKKGFTTHLRLKYSNKYEDSKKLANIRGAWNNDKDKTLANLEVSLKSQQRGQILDRLHEEWNKLAAKSYANHRSKEAIRGCRQQPEYKAILAGLQNELKNKSSKMTDSATTLTESSPSMDTVTKSEYVIFIQNLMKEILTSHEVKSKYMKDAINAVLNSNETEDPVKLTILGIHQSIKECREKYNKSINFLSETTGLTSRKKPARNKNRIEKANKGAYYTKLYMNNKPRRVEELIEGITPNTEPSSIHEAIRHYENIWSTYKSDTQLVDHQPDPEINNKILLSPITKVDIE
ncbi:unnamed protein product [Rotaria sordida]|uniref:Uncharacterized protein n=1 Tax=Rotaria sordida TaxID=392033 RepID=A0A815PGM2_9BILA|nr:unnamed protein product [Rotaria sordida]